MTLTQLQEEIIKKCPYYRGGTEHHCNERLARVCFLFEDDGLPDYCRHFEKISNTSVAILDRVWKNSKRKKGEKQLLKTAIIKYLLENGQIIQKDMIRENLISERKLKYHWRRLMEELGLKWKRDEGKNYRYKIYRATYRKKRELKRMLKDLNRNSVNKGKKLSNAVNYVKVKFLGILTENLHDKKMLKCEKKGRRQSNKSATYLPAGSFRKAEKGNGGRPEN